MRFLAVLVGLSLLFCAARARADEVAPELEGADLRVKAGLELQRLVATMDVGERRRLAGVYVAFDASVSDPIAQAACDDDGDYVVVISDAMLRLVSQIAVAATIDESGAKLDEHADHLARSQVPGKRLLPPPPGFFGTGRVPSSEERLAEILAFLVGRELAHLRAGDLVCPRPTATKESGDDVWTDAERAGASAAAATLYPGKQTERDAEAVQRLAVTGRSGAGAVAFLRFFARLETGRGRFAPSYARLHPGAAARAAALKAAPAKTE